MRDEPTPMFLPRVPQNIMEKIVSGDASEIR
jgi:hypothetical protein